MPIGVDSKVGTFLGLEFLSFLLPLFSTLLFLLFLCNSSSSSSRTSSRSNSPSQHVSEQSQKRLVRTMLKSNGTPPRASPKTGWGTPTRMVSISSSNDNSSTNTMKTMPSPKSSPIPLSLFRSSASQSDQTISSASNGTIESIPKHGGLFIHEGQAESFQRIQTSIQFRTTFMPECLVSVNDTCITSMKVFRCLLIFVLVGPCMANIWM